MQVKNDGASEWLPKDGQHDGQGSDQWLTYVDFFFLVSSKKISSPISTRLCH
jgi:hypothetical protein